MNGITDWTNPLVKCRNCRKPFIGKNVINLYAGYHEYCCLSCAGKSQDVNRKKKLNSLARHGVAHPSMLAETTIKRKHTVLKLRGNENWNNCSKAKRTRLSKFGQYAPSDHAEKCKRTKIRNGHPENWNNCEKSAQTRLLKNNGKYESAESKAKRQSTCTEKFGYATNLQSEDTKIKSA